MAYFFNSSGTQYLQFNNGIGTSTLPITMAGRARRITSNYDIIVALDSSTNGFTGLNILLTSTGSTAAAHHNTGSTTGTAFGPSVSQNTNYHLCGIFRSSTYRAIYLNGAFGGSNSTSLTLGTLDRIRIGCRIQNGSITGPLYGYIEEVGIWNAELTPEEIKALSNGVTPDKIRPQNLKFYCPLTRDLIEYTNNYTLSNINTATVTPNFQRSI